MGLILSDLPPIHITSPSREGSNQRITESPQFKKSSKIIEPKLCLIPTLSAQSTECHIQVFLDTSRDGNSTSPGSPGRSRAPLDTVFWNSSRCQMWEGFAPCPCRPLCSKPQAPNTCTFLAAAGREARNAQGKSAELAALGAHPAQPKAMAKPPSCCACPISGACPSSGGTGML